MSATSPLKAPFPWFGGKRRVADLVWQRFGDTLNYVEPFAGSLAVLLARPFPARTETVNDADPFLSNFWRAVTADPDQVAYHADWPVSEADLHARHAWLVGATPRPARVPAEFDKPGLREAYLAGWRDSYSPNDPKAFKNRMMTDPTYYDARIAGWWVWGLSAWIGSGWCSLERVDRHSGIKVDGTTERKRPNLGGDRGVVARKVHHNGGIGVHHSPTLSRPNLRPAQGIHASALKEKAGGIYAYMRALSERLRHTRVVCGDWSRVGGASVTYKIGVTAVFLDPPYDPSIRCSGLYAIDDTGHEQDKPISTVVREWCLAEVEDKWQGGQFRGPRYLHPKLRIALCGYEGEGHEVLESLGWEVVAWKASGGYAGQNKAGNDNPERERIWFSPHCLKVMSSRQLPLGDFLE